MVSLRKLVFFATYANAALSSGRHDAVSLDDVLEQMEDGRLIGWIEQLIDGGDVRLSPLALYSVAERVELNSELAVFATAELSSYYLDDGSRGLALVVATALSAISQRVNRAATELEGDPRHKLHRNGDDKR